MTDIELTELQANVAQLKKEVAQHTIRFNGLESALKFEERISEAAKSLAKKENDAPKWCEHIYHATDSWGSGWRWSNKASCGGLVLKDVSYCPHCGVMRPAA